MLRPSRPCAHVIGAAGLLIAAATTASAQGAPPPKPSHLQGQVVDSAGHPVASALVETDDPPRATLSDAKGFFRFAELPAGPITVRVRRDGYAGTEFQLRLPPDSTVGIGVKLLGATPAVEAVHLEAASGADAGLQARTLRVVSAEGQPIMYANVVVEGATTRITDEKGEVSLGAGKREAFTVRVSRIGFAPWFGKVDLADTTAAMTIALARVAQALAPVTVTGAASKSSLERTGFYDRWMMRQKGVLSAVFIGPEEIEFRHPDKITNVLRGLNGVCLAPRTTGSRGHQQRSANLYAFSSAAASITGLGGTCPNCPMAIVIDGVQQFPPPAIDDVLDANDVAGIEVYDRGGNMPIGMQFQDTKCGVIALWTGSRK